MEEHFASGAAAGEDGVDDAFDLQVCGVGEGLHRWDALGGWWEWVGWTLASH